MGLCLQIRLQPFRGLSHHSANERTALLRRVSKRTLSPSPVSAIARSFHSKDPEVEDRLATETVTLMRKYELPDGRVVKVGRERFMAAEALFQPYVAAACPPERRSDVLAIVIAAAAAC